MLVPATHQAALLLLILAFVCLGSWVNTFRIAKWRFELYYLDFAIGALALSVLTAFTLGTLGSELSFNDRIAVAGLRSQAFALAAGFLFNLGNMLLVAAVSLVGMTIAFPLALSLAFVISAYFQGTGSLALFGGGTALLLLACGFSIAAARIRSAAKPGTTAQSSQTRRSRAIKGIVVGLVGGLVIGASSPLAASSLWGDLGLGAYAGLLMFSIGLLISAVFFDLFFLNIGLEGGRVTFATYRAGSLGQHFGGIVGGALWACGMLATLLAQSGPGAETPTQSTLTIFVQGSVLLVMSWGLLGWRELSAAPKARASILVGFLCFAAAIAVMALRTKT